MKVRSIMSCPPRAVPQTDSIGSAATIMANCKAGALAVVDDGRVVGIVTDRDLALRGLASGLPGGSPVAAVMTAEPIICHPDDELADALSRMRLHGIRRLPVCTTQGALVGILSLDDAAQEPEYGAEATETLARICDTRRRRGQRQQAA